MADTKHVPVSSAPTEGDGVNYSGIGWFLVILTVTTLFCQALVWGGFKLMEEVHVARAGVARPPLSQPPAEPTIGEKENAGRILTGLGNAPAPAMLVDEPSALAEFRRREEASLSSYGWINKPLGVVRIPIDRAKTLIVERGLPARAAAPSEAKPVATPSAPATPPPAPAKPAAGH
jgi:hypothetical protein